MKTIKLLVRETIDYDLYIQVPEWFTEDHYDHLWDTSEIFEDWVYGMLRDGSNGTSPHELVCVVDRTIVYDDTPIEVNSGVTPNEQVIAVFTELSL